MFGVRLIKFEGFFACKFRIQCQVTAHGAASEIDADFHFEQTFNLTVQRFEFFFDYQSVGCFVVDKGFVLEFPEYEVFDYFLEWFV